MFLYVVPQEIKEMIVILKLEFASGRLPLMANLTGPAIRDPRHQGAQVLSMTTPLEVQVCFFDISSKLWYGFLQTLVCFCSVNDVYKMNHILFQIF